MKEKRFSNKKVISLVLAVMMLVGCIFSLGLPVAIAVTEESTQTSAANAQVPFSWDNASVYFLMTDRFYNGNTSNDHAYGRGLNQNGSEINLSATGDGQGMFQGGDFAGITQKINEGYFNDLGVNAIWMSAPYEQIHGYVVAGDGNSIPHYSYHGYYVLDYTETDLNFGTEEEFRTLVDTAHENGIRIVLDIVMNHAGYNTLKDMADYNFGGVKSGWENYYYSHQNVNNSDYHGYIDYDSNNWGNWWGGDWVRAGLPGYTEGGGDIDGSLAGLPDFKTGTSSQVGIPNVLETKWQQEGTYNQKVAKYGSSNSVKGYLIDWLAEWVREYGVDGFRADTAKHVEASVWNELANECTAALKEWKAANPDKALDDEEFWMTGEAWGHTMTDSYYFDNGFDSMINFELAPGVGQSNIPGASSVESYYSRYANAINNDPTFNVLTYISSHDTTLASGDRVHAGSVLLMMPGGIQIFYGDETNRPLLSQHSGTNAGAGHQFRSFMNWSSIDTTVQAHWQKLGTFRNNHLSVGAGQHKQISGYNGSTGYTYSRTYASGDYEDSVIITQYAPKNQNIEITVSSIWGDGEVLTNAYDGSTATVTNGKVTFNSGSQGTILIEGEPSTIALSLSGNSVFEGSQELTVNLSGADYATVTVDGTNSFQVTNGQKFTIGEETALGGQVTVTITASNDEDTVSKTYTYTKRDPNAVVMLYFDNDAYNWSTVNAYIYDESGASVINNGEWPGQAMTLDSATGYYSIEVPKELEFGNVIFTESYSATADRRHPDDGEAGLAIDGSTKLLSAGNSFTDYQRPGTTDPNPTNPPVTGGYVLGDANSDKAVSVMDVLEIQKHLADIGGLTGDDAKGADVDASGDITVKDALNIQRYLSDYSVEYKIGELVGGSTTTPTDPEGTTPEETEPEVKETRTITLENANWGSVNIYYWADGYTPLTWPGTAMTKSGNNYTFEVPSEATHVIFNGNGQQTADLTLPSGDGDATYNMSSNSWS